MAVLLLSVRPLLGQDLLLSHHYLVPLIIRPNQELPACLAPVPAAGVPGN